MQKTKAAVPIYQLDASSRNVRRDSDHQFDQRQPYSRWRRLDFDKDTLSFLI